MGSLCLFSPRKWERILVFNPWYLLFLTSYQTHMAHYCTLSLTPKDYHSSDHSSHGLCSVPTHPRLTPPYSRSPTSATPTLILCSSLPVSGHLDITAGVGRPPCGRSVYIPQGSVPPASFEMVPISNEVHGNLEQSSLYLVTRQRRPQFLLGSALGGKGRCVCRFC